MLENQMNPRVLSIVSLTTVFVVLFLVALLIRVIKALADVLLGVRAEPSNGVTSEGPRRAARELEKVAKPSNSNAAKITAISAAVAAFLKDEGFEVVRIRRVASSERWVRAARLENVMSLDRLKSRR